MSEEDQRNSAPYRENRNRRSCCELSYKNPDEILIRSKREPSNFVLYFHDCVDHEIGNFVIFVIESGNASLTRKKKHQ